MCVCVCVRVYMCVRVCIAFERERRVSCSFSLSLSRFPLAVLFPCEGERFAKSCETRFDWVIWSASENRTNDEERFLLFRSLPSSFSSILPCLPSSLLPSHSTGRRLARRALKEHGPSRSCSLPVPEVPSRRGRKQGNRDGDGQRAAVKKGRVVYALSFLVVVPPWQPP